MDILIATANRYKVYEMRWFLNGIDGLIIHDLSEIDHRLAIDEDGQTLQENAGKKARAYSKVTGWYVLASDGGNAIPALGPKWNVLSNQRIVGENKSDAEKIDSLLFLMKDLKSEDRKVIGYFALALAKDGLLLWAAQDQVDQFLLLDQSPPCPIPLHTWFGHIGYYPQFQKTYNQMSDREKNMVRRKAKPLKQALHRQIRKMLSMR